MARKLFTFALCLVSTILVAGRAGEPQRFLYAGVPGVANAATARLFVSTSRRLAAFDLTTDTVVWEQNYGGKCCDRIAISPDGRTLYAPAAGAPKWYVVNAADGALVTTIDKEGSPHNTI